RHHGEDGFHETGTDAECDDAAACAQGRPGDWADDVCGGPCPDRRQLDRVTVAEEPGDDGSDEEGQHHAENEGDDPAQAGLLHLLEARSEPGCDDRQIDEHSPAHESDPGEDADVCQTVFAASGDTSDVGQDKAEDDGDGRGLELAPGEHLRDQNGQSGDHTDQCEGDDEVVVRQSRDKSFHHRSSANSSTGASTPGVFTRLSTGTSAKLTMTA